MAVQRAGAEFDEISEVYDATREPLEPEAVDAIASTLLGWGIRRVLEVGVGTGRIAVPLAARGPEVTGIDASWGMLARAKAKGVTRLVRGSAYRLPFPDRTFDTALFVHVLHLLEDPTAALTEAARVARCGVTALVRPPVARETDDRQGLSARRIVVDRLRAEGVPLPDQARGGPPSRERQLLVQFPPDRLVTVSEDDVTEPLADQLKIFERRASRWTLRVPPEKLARAVEDARQQVGDRTHTYHRVRALAFWERAPGTPAPLSGSSPTLAQGS